MYLFGFDQRSSLLEDAKQYLPFLDYLNRATGYNFKLRFTPQSSSIVDALGQGNVHFAAIGAVSFLEAELRYGIIPLVRGVNIDGRTEYQSIVIVRPDSEIEDIAALKGKRLAFGSINSTQGHLIPRIVLAEHGVSLEDLGSHTYTGSHFNCADAVIKGQADACGMQDTMARSLADQGFVKILYESAHFPSSGIAAHKGVPAAVLDSVRKALLDFDPTGRDQPGLYRWTSTEMPLGFEVALSSDYRELKKWAVHFGFLPSDADNGAEAATQ